jgi:hypothetical protein
VLAIALAPMVLLAIGAYYGQEILHRLYLFALAPMAYFGAELLAVNKRWLTAAICLLLIAGLPLHVIAHYGNEAMDYVSPAQIAGLHSFHDHTSEGYLTRAGYLREMENAEHYFRIPIDMLCLADGGVAVQGTFDPALPHYVRITRQDREFYRFYRGTPEDYDDVEHRLAYSANYNLVYDDVDLRLYAAESIQAVQECGQSDQAR